MDRVLEADYSTQQDFSPDEALGKRLDVYGEFDTGGPERDDFSPLLKDLVKTNIWSIFDLINEIIYGSINDENIFEPENEEEPDYSSDTELTNQFYKGSDIEELALPSLTIIKYEPEQIDILFELQKRIKEEKEIDYEESDEEQPPIFQLREKKESLEQEIKKSA